ncbi:hypothetical protein PISMIDRAFT_17895 [Pisolithus microcarpus 441]|uniref:Uncharacterized protein n=1 Tax=Pisolithus microcarpus 441 TaxID=765257 RepID=A0A0C9XMI3_9AGAM|nr:hypothetical protein PISMIDRAFT_17895 [Pisolithus microcarpus 441]
MGELQHQTEKLAEERRIAREQALEWTREIQVESEGECECKAKRTLKKYSEVIDQRLIILATSLLVGHRRNFIIDSGTHLPLVFFIWYSDTTFSITYVLFVILWELNVVQDLMMLNVIEAMVYPMPPSRALPQQVHPISSISEVPPFVLRHPIPTSNRSSYTVTPSFRQASGAMRPRRMQTPSISNRATISSSKNMQPLNGMLA